MKNILILLIVLNATACTFSGFKPPRQTAYWTSPKGAYEDITYLEYVYKKHDDMRKCGIDPFNGYHNSIEEGLCMETKGWRWTRGPVCEDMASFKTEILNGSSCRAWRQKHGK